MIYPVVHKVAVKLYVEDFGIDATLKTYERLFAILTSDGTIREDQFNLTGRMFRPKRSLIRLPCLQCFGSSRAGAANSRA